MTFNDPIQVRTSLRDVFFILFYKLHVFIGTFIVIAVLVLGYTFFSKPVYLAKGSVLVKPFFDSSQRLHTQERFDVLPVSEQDINTEINIMNSDVLMRRVTTELQLDKVPLIAGSLAKGNNSPPNAVENAVQWLRAEIEIKPVPVSSIIDVSLKGTDARRIEEIVNTFLNFYIDHHISVHRTGGGVDFYNQQTEHAQKMLLDAENELMDFQKKNAIIDIVEQRANNVALMRLTEQEISLLRAQISKAGTVLDKLRPFFKKRKPLTILPEDLRSNESLVDLQKALIPLLMEKERIALMYPKSSVEYQDAQNQIDRIDKEIYDQQAKVFSGFEVDLAALNSRKKTLEDDIKRIKKESEQLTLNETALNRLMRDVDQRKRNYQLYLDIREDALIQAQREGSRVANVSVTSWANEPVIPIFPKKKLMLIFAVGAGILAGIGGAFAAYFLDHSIKRPEEMEKDFQIPVLATLEEFDGPTSKAK